jgi:alpha-N-arabinofuranosidase
VNRHPEEAASFSTDLRAFGDDVTVVESALLWDEDLFAVNTAQDPSRVAPQPHPSAVVDGTTLRAQLPPASWSMVVLQVGAAVAAAPQE